MFAFLCIKFKDDFYIFILFVPMGPSFDPRSLLEVMFSFYHINLSLMQTAAR